MPRKPAAKKQCKPSTKRKPGRGRPPAQPDFYKMVRGLALLGYTDTELAGHIGISPRTLAKWKKDKPDFMQSLKEGRDLADGRVVNALLERALGYNHAEDKIFLHEGEPVIVPTTKHYPPDTGACFIWLKNRQTDKWKDFKHVEIPIDPAADKGKVANMVEKTEVTTWRQLYETE